MGADFAPVITETATEDFQVMPINWPSVCTFLDCHTQWRAVEVSRGQEKVVTWLGLIYEAVEVVLRRLEKAHPEIDGDQVWRDLLVMEAAALDAFAGVTS
nr:DUF1799 domain-containing protein [uncultured Celeribacter sp.]